MTQQSVVHMSPFVPCQTMLYMSAARQDLLLHRLAPRRVAPTHGSARLRGPCGPHCRTARLAGQVWTCLWSVCALWLA